MRKFLLHLSLFLAIFLAFYAVLWGRYIFLMYSYSFRLPASKTLLVIGDSQTQAAVDGSLLHNVANVSQAHEHYFSTYRRLQLYLSANPQIDTVLMGVTPHSLSPIKDEFLDEDWYVGDVVKQYLPYLTFADYGLLLRHNAAGVAAALFTPLSFYADVSPQYVYNMGHFGASDDHHLSSDDGARLRCSDSIEYNEIAIAFMHRIETLCRDRHIALIGLNTPVYHARQYLQVDYFYKLLDREFPNLELWDYMNESLPDSCRRDINHLNRSGARAFSEELKIRMSLP